MGIKYLSAPVTIGEKIRNKRLERKILQKDVAKIFGVTECTVQYWENNKVQPSIRQYPDIIKFLGYFPFELDMESLGGKLEYYRYKNGLTRRDLADILFIDESTVYHYEKGKHKPTGGPKEKLIKLLRKENIQYE